MIDILTDLLGEDSVEHLHKFGAKVTEHIMNLGDHADSVHEVAAQATEHVMDDSADAVIENVIDNVEKSVDAYMASSESNMQSSLANVMKSIDEGAARMTELTFGYSDIDLTESFENQDLSGTEDLGNPAGNGAEAISFLGATEHDKAFQEYQEILAKHNESIPPSKKPLWFDDHISSSGARDLKNLARDLYRAGKVSASEENRMLSLVDKM